MEYMRKFTLYFDFSVVINSIRYDTRCSDGYIR